MGKRVIHRSRMPAYLPINGTAVTALLLDRFRAPLWLWSALAVLYAFLWIGVIASMATETEVDPLA